MKVDYEIYTLQNGMRILLIPYSETYSVTVSALIKSGSAYESADTQGITHFIEHLAVKATKKWPRKNQFITTVEKNGGTYNGGTSKELLDYYINIPHTKLDFGVEFLYQILYKATLSEEIIEQERTVILDEISKREDNVGYKNNKFISKLLLKKQSQYALDIAGTPELIKKYTKKDLQNRYEEAHDPSKIFLTIVGKFKKEKAKSLINKYFSNVTTRKKQKKLPLDLIKTSIIKTKRDKLTNLVLTTLIFPGLNKKDTTTKESFLMDTVLKILSGTRSSRLFKRLRTQEGLLYHIGADAMIYKHFGALFVYFDTPPEIFNKTLSIVFEEMEKFIDKGVDNKELSHIKEYLTNRNLVYYDTIRTYAKLIINPLFSNKEVILLEDLNKYINSITKRDIDTFVKKYFNLSKMNFIAYGNVNSTTKSSAESLFKKLSNGNSN